jgi:response regulator RpfG family c-di-GMP phosphodiesterase
MKYSNYNAPLTAKLYILAAILFASYGGRVCPMLETLTATEVFTHVIITFSCLLMIRHFFLANHFLIKEIRHAKLDSVLFFIGSIPLALYYNISYEFPIDSNLKILFGMALFGFFSGSILQLTAKLTQMNEMHRTDQFQFDIQGQRSSLVKQMILLVVFLLMTLTIMLTMVAVKDIFWLEHNPARILDGSGKISVIKELIYLSVILTGYTIAIMILWSKVIKRILLSQESALDMVSKGNIDIRLPIFNNDELGSTAALTNTMLDTLQSAQREITETRDAAIISLSALAESRDNETGGHILRTQEYVKVLAEQLSQADTYSALLTSEYIELLYKSAPLHDIGKVGIPDNILLKPGKLTDDEFDIMKGHSQIGADALSIAETQLGNSSFLRLAKEVSLTHHEKWDGTGYPNQLSKKDIPLSGRLMALADVYDALTSKRIYKPALSHQEATKIIIEGSGSHFDPDIIQAFLAIEEKFVTISADFQDVSSK